MSGHKVLIPDSTGFTGSWFTTLHPSKIPTVVALACAVIDIPGRIVDVAMVGNPSSLGGSIQCTGTSEIIISPNGTEALPRQARGLVWALMQIGDELKNDLSCAAFTDHFTFQFEANHEEIINPTSFSSTQVPFGCHFTVFAVTRRKVGKWEHEIIDRPYPTNIRSFSQLPQTDLIDLVNLTGSTVELFKGIWDQVCISPYQQPRSLCHSSSTSASSMNP